CYFHPVAMTPYAREGIEVAVQIALVISVIPEEQGHAGHGLSADQFADFINHSLTRIIESMHGGAQYPALHFTPVNRRGRIATNERAGEVGTPRHGRQPDIATANILLDPVIAVGRQG